MLDTTELSETGDMVMGKKPRVRLAEDIIDVEGVTTVVVEERDDWEEAWLAVGLAGGTISMVAAELVETRQFMSL